MPRRYHRPGGAATRRECRRCVDGTRRFRQREVMAFHSTDPTTGEVWATHPEATEQEIDRALDRAASARTVLATSSIADRAAFLRTLATCLRAARADHAILMAREMGKPVFDG